jgi:hypothetical protein
MAQRAATGLCHKVADAQRQMLQAGVGLAKFGGAEAVARTVSMTAATAFT